jgi:hypothetical protein
MTAIRVFADPRQVGASGSGTTSVSGTATSSAAASSGAARRGVEMGPGGGGMTLLAGSMAMVAVGAAARLVL